MYLSRQFKPDIIEEEKGAFNAPEPEYVLYCFTVNLKLGAVVVFPVSERILIFNKDGLVVDDVPFAVLDDQPVDDAAHERVPSLAQEGKLSVGVSRALE